MVNLSSAIKRATAKPKKAGPVWSGPCGEGPQGGVTQSLLCKWLQCRERFRLLTFEGLKPVEGFNVRLFFGNAWHVCEENHAMNRDWRLPLQLFASVECQKYRLQQDQVAHWARVVETQFPVYVDYWASNDHVRNREPLLSEEVFDVPLPLPSGRTVRLRGKFDSVDAVREKRSAGVWLMENKTKSKIDEQRIKQRLSFDVQTGMYLVALYNADLEEIGLSERTMPGPIKGVRYNVIRRDCPISRHKAKSNKAKKTFTPEETEDHFYARLRDDYFAADPQDWFMRWEAVVTPSDVNRFRQEFLNPCLEHLCDWWEWVTLAARSGASPFAVSGKGLAMHWRTPYGAGVVDDYDDYAPMMETGSTVGFQKVTDLFPELAEAR